MKAEDRGPVALLMATSALLGAALYLSAPAETAVNIPTYQVQVSK